MFYFVGLACACFFAWYVFRRIKGTEPTRQEIRIILEKFLDGTGGEWDWDDFICVPIEDAELEEIRLRCAQLDREFPAEKKGHYCNQQGLDVIRNYIEVLR